MTSKLKCPFCQQELIREGMNHWWCSCNIEHQGKELYGTTALWQSLIDGKKAQRQLRTVKDRCVKKIKAKEREIANYLNGISVRDKEIQNLREQLQKTQDAIQKIKDIVYPALDREFYSELRDDMLYIGRIIVSVEKQEE